ncbi:hypothetical protein ACFYTQ_02395 [Nocardia sp. NPDC004068]|uniref:hypothetical protein n=1 Tax=Nocardia sp. NPDC004068 TaxID=3364303 RepID=UPI003683181A
MTTRNATVGEWRALLTHRAARHRDGLFLVHGRAALTAAVANDWPIEALLYRLGTPELPPGRGSCSTAGPGVPRAAGRARHTHPPRRCRRRARGARGAAGVRARLLGCDDHRDRRRDALAAPCVASIALYEILRQRRTL